MVCKQTCYVMRGVQIRVQSIVKKLDVSVSVWRGFADFFLSSRCL